MGFAVLNFTNRKFPNNFLFGVSTAAYQIEGGWNEDGKGPSNWDYYTHNFPDMMTDRSNGDIAADSYHLYEEDINLAKNLGVWKFTFGVLTK